MKAIFFILCLVAVSHSQPTRPSPFDPEDSMCARMCEVGQRCLSRKLTDRVVAECIDGIPETGSCVQRPILEGGDELEREIVVDDGNFEPERVDMERAEGARGRVTARSINGAESRPMCVDGLTCTSNNTCRQLTTRCASESSREIKCDRDGRFEATQCRRMEGTDIINCYCVHPDTGVMIAGTSRRVMTRDDVPDCEPRSYSRCNVTRDGRMVSVRQGEAVSMSQDNRCQRCTCEDGRLNCMNRGLNDRCPRSDPNERPATCMRDGMEMQHGDRMMDGRCNMCGCRNGELYCTEVKECRGEDSDAGSDRDSDDMRCDECMNMPRGPVCAMRDGRTFPTRCHAMKCQGFEMGDLMDGSCSKMNACTNERCGRGFSCMRRGGQTRMSRDGDSSDNRRLCVNLTELRCQSTEVGRDGERRIVEDDDDVDMMSDRDGSGSDRTACASDGNTYPSTCHMMTEARNDTLPRVMHPGMCSRPGDARNLSVCGTDGMTYNDVRTMRTIGGNVRMDYMGRCENPGNSDDDDTPAKRCMKVRATKRCPTMDNCSRMTEPEDGCCPVCGGSVIVAIDQEAMDEHVRNTGELNGVDEMMGRFIRSNVVSDEAPMKCEVSMTRPTTSRGNTTEVLFRARNATDGAVCHGYAVRMMMMLNEDQVMTTVSIAESFVAAAIVAPEAVVDGGAPAFVASSVLMMLLSALATLLI